MLTDTQSQKIIPVLSVGDDEVMRVLMGLRERREDFLSPRSLFRSSRMGLLEGIWSDLCLNGEGVERSRCRRSREGRGVVWSRDTFRLMVPLWSVF